VITRHIGTTRPRRMSKMSHHATKTRLYQRHSVCQSPLPAPICQGKPHLAWDKAELDHIKPLERGGSNHPRNLRLLCPVCHALRADGWHFQLRERMEQEGKLPEEWWIYTWEG